MTVENAPPGVSIRFNRKVSPLDCVSMLFYTWAGSNIVLLHNLPCCLGFDCKELKVSSVLQFEKMQELPVIPLSLSTFSLSRTCLLASPGDDDFVMVPVNSSNLSASVLLPWSICAMMPKFLHKLNVCISEYVKDRLQLTLFFRMESLPFAIVPSVCLFYQSQPA